MGAAPNWQLGVEKALANYDVLILNPRRDDWDSSWEQDISNPEFKGQVTWELDGQNAADICLYVFAPNKECAAECEAPITLLELGLHAKDFTMVCCPEGYYRKGNVDVVCEYFGIPVYEDIIPMMEDLRAVLDEHFGGGDKITNNKKIPHLPAGV